MRPPLEIVAFGARWRVDTEGLDEVSQERLHVLWDRCRVEPGDEDEDQDGDVETFRVSDHVHESEPADEIPYAVSRALTLASLVRRRGQALMLHAAGLSLGERAVALVAPSGTGKSTAARVLGQEFGYLSDETVCVEADDSISPYAKPVSIVTDPVAPFTKHELSPDELGLLRPDHPAYLAAVIILERDPTLTTPELATVPLIEALLTLIPQTSSLPLIDRPLQRLAMLAQRSGGPYLLRYSEIGDCAGVIRSVLERPEQAQLSTWTGIDAPTADGSDGRPLAVAAGSGVITRSPWVDAVRSADGTLLLIGATPVRLGPIGEVVWGVAERGTTAGDALAAVLEVHGDHPEAAELVGAGIDEMVRSGVLRRA